MRVFLASALLLLWSAPSLAQDEPEAAPPKARAEDVASMDAILGTLYDVISGPAEKARDWDRFRSLFVPGARLIPTAPNRAGGASARVLTVEDYVTMAGPALERDGFFESEVARKVDTFGNIAHAFSTYESRRAEGEEPFVRGINSIQLLKDGDRWWIVTIYWDAERPENPIPDAYRPKP